MGHSENGTLDLTQNDELSKLPSEKYRDALKSIIKENFGSAAGDCTVTIEAGSAKGDNYIGVLYRATVTDPRGNKLSIVVKLPPANIARREQFFARPCFVRESDFYDTIFPLYKKFQSERGIAIEKEGFHEVAKCYRSLTDEFHEGLFFEDLKEAGYEMFDRFKDATADHVNTVMRVLGKYHAISFAMKDQQPELLEKYKTMEDIFFQRDEMSKDMIKIWYDQLKKQAMETVSSSENEGLKEKATKVLESDFFELLSGCIDGAIAEPYSVLSHGDCWNNNFMFKNENGVPVDIRFLDWQIMRYASPVCDLTYYIFGCTTKALRDRHYNEFLDTYYNSLSAFLKRLGSDPSKVFPREAFEDQLVRFGKFGLAMAIMILPMITSRAEDIPDMDEIAEKFKDHQENGVAMDETTLSFTSASTQGAYHDRMSGVFQDMYDLGYI